LRDSQGNILQIRSNLILPSEITSECPVSVTGFVRLRPENHRRPGQAFELELTQIHLLNSIPSPLPFLPSESEHVNLETRMKHRHIDLRNKSVQSRLRKRHSILTVSRKFLEREGFIEIETPLLFKSTVEGAREFIVPTRKRGFVYALPQSPQQYKQILMGSGFDRYFQVARCFRDEDLRADRQPEFTQVGRISKLILVGFGNGVCG
jgi:aspartyl-tRNA synthetase